MPVVDELEFYLYMLEFILIILAIVIVVHGFVVMLWSYWDTGDFLFYLRNFYHNVYAIDF